MTHWLVDAMNVIGSRPDGWWRDRDGAVRRLVAKLVVHCDRAGDLVTVVVDGRRVGDLPTSDAVDVIFAGGGPGAADDEIVRLLVGPGGLHDVDRVVTSDRGLVERLPAEGPAVEPAGRFSDLVDPQ